MLSLSLMFWDFRVQDSTLAVLAQLAVERASCRDRKDIGYCQFSLHGVQADEDDAQRALAFIKPDVVLRLTLRKLLMVGFQEQV